MLSVDAFQERLICELLTAVAVKPVGTVGGCESGGAGVVADAGALCAEQLPAASHADTE